ncbi:hypothetical protein [Streptomyces noursei]|uniref:hypothetical protein n=1 Tax=Streptomyces noursei TaxID=1971 RepID=UPI0019A2FE2C|nr:hypothetical protein [Streptomyces noursei]MCZ1013979.1 hypothetical protein [Streptomyces noursei]GGX40441.1 hypothetical protein GCM10010341_72940 [Streptomyces noursei]
MPARTQITTKTTWPEGVIARYLTVGGATVDVTYTSHSGWLTATCSGCGQIERTETYGFIYDTPEQEAERVEKALPESRELAQSHAEKCRAVPRPVGE